MPMILAVSASMPTSTSTVTSEVSGVIFFTSMGTLALAKGTSSFGLACATRKVASAEAEALET